MAIFNRRTIQVLLDCNIKTMNQDQLLRHVKCLNSLKDESLGSEWELALLKGLQRIGKVEYEKDFGVKNRIDVFFKSFKGEELLADIVTINDKGYEAVSPYESFQEEVIRIIRKHKLIPNRFSIKAEAESDKLIKVKKVRLLVPPKNNWPLKLKEKFSVYLKDVAKNGDQELDFFYNEESINIHINFKSSRVYLQGSYPSYKITYSLTNNPVFNALKRKSRQLKSVDYFGPKGIIVCDGDCSILHQSGYGLRECALIDIVKEFFRQNTSIGFILIFSIFRKEDLTNRMGKPYINLRYYLNDLSKQNLSEAFINEIVNLPKFMPAPIDDSRNAVNYLNSKFKKQGWSKEGSLSMTENTIKFSSRSLLRLLSGEIKQIEFFKKHPYLPGHIRRMLEEGRLIDEITIEKTDEDDDWVKINFSKPDPAISSFVLPNLN